MIRKSGIHYFWNGGVTEVVRHNVMDIQPSSIKKPVSDGFCRGRGRKGMKLKRTSRTLLLFYMGQSGEVLCNMVKVPVLRDRGAGGGAALTVPPASRSGGPWG